MATIIRPVRLALKEAPGLRVLFCLNPSELAGPAWSKVLERTIEQSPDGDVGCLTLDYRPDVRSSRPAPMGVYSEVLSTLSRLDAPRSPSTLSSFAEFRNGPGYAEFRFVAIKLLNRKDLTGTFRFLEREVVFQAHVLGALDLMLRRSPKLVVFGVTPHEFLPFVVSTVAEYLGIETLSFQPSQIAPTMLARSSVRGVFVPAGASVRESRVAVDVLEKSRAGLAALQGTGQPRYMELQKARDQEVNKPSQRFRALIWSVAWLSKVRFPESVDFSGHAKLPSFLAQLIRVLLTRSLQQTLSAEVKRLGSTNSLLNAPFAVFALTYEPEANALPAGLPIDFQGDAVLMTRSLLPGEISLVVKEHTSQHSAALRGFLGRSPLFYKLIESMPGTSFVGTSLRLSEIVEQSTAVFTLTGTVAIEAVNRGIPAVYFGSPWWEGLPGTVRFSEIYEFADLNALELPTTQEVEAFFVTLTSDRMIPGTATERASTIEKRFGKLPEEFWEAEALSIWSCICELVDQRR